MTRKIIFTIFLIALLFPFKLVAVTQGSDEVTLLKPSQGQNVTGTFEVEWKVVDSDVTDPAYFIDIFNLSCDQSGGNIGRLINAGARKNGEIYSYSWDTSTGNLSGSLQSQGNYCMRVCGILAESGSVYSLCDKQSFVFSSGGQSQGNNPPEIEASKEGFSVTLNEIFSHKVVASDPDDDKITFSLVNAPDFLSIDSSTGLVSGKPTEVGDIKFIVKADDGNGGVTTQEFVMSVQVEGARKEVEFSFPVSGSSVTSENNEIKWDIDSNIQVKTIVLSFSQDRSDWQEITRLDRDTGSYKWNVNELDPGEYYLRVQLTDTSNRLFEIISEKFNVSATAVVDQTAIINLVPTEGSTLDNNRPIISASFNTPEDVSIDKEDVKFTLNDRIDLTVCEVFSNGITCNVLSELADGQYTAYIELKDSDGSTVVKEWSFNVTVGGPSGGGVVSGNTLQWIIIILAVGFVLIALPWSLYLFLKRRKNNKAENDQPSRQPQQVIYPVGGPEDQFSQTSPVGVQPIITSTQEGQTTQVFADQTQINSQGVVPPVSGQPESQPVGFVPEQAPVQMYTMPPTDISQTPSSTPLQTEPGGLVDQQATTLGSEPVTGQVDQLMPAQAQTGQEFQQSQDFSQSPTDDRQSGVIGAVTTPQEIPQNPQTPVINSDSEFQSDVIDPSIQGDISTPSSPPEVTKSSTEQPVVGIQEVGVSPQSVSSDMPAPVVPPGMYDQEEIPQWLQTTSAEEVKIAPAAEGGDSNSPVDDIVSKADILEGGKVYDPYGIALNSDETQTQTPHN